MTWPEPRQCFLSLLLFPRAQVRPKPPFVHIVGSRTTTRSRHNVFSTQCLLDAMSSSTRAPLNPSRLARIPLATCAHLPEQCYVTCLLCKVLSLLRYFNAPSQQRHADPMYIPVPSLITPNINNNPAPRHRIHSSDSTTLHLLVILSLFECISSADARAPRIPQ